MLMLLFGIEQGGSIDPSIELNQGGSIE